jgi:hypothetical protein
MRHLVAAALAVALFVAVAPTTSAADASCDAVVADLPTLTGNIQTEWVVQNCSSRTSVRVTLSELRGDGWERADCDGSVDNCTIVRPTGTQDCGDGTLYCAYATLNKTEVWNQSGDPCARQWRTKVTVRNPSGDVIASDTSPANTC